MTTTIERIARTSSLYLLFTAACALATSNCRRKSGSDSISGLARIDIDAASIEARVSFGAECEIPHAASIAQDGRAYVVCEGDHVSPGAVIEIDPVALHIVKRFDVSVYPDGIVFGE